VQAGAHDLLHHVESGKAGRVHHQQTVSLGEEPHLSLLGGPFTSHAVAGKGFAEDQGGVIFVEFVLFEVQDIEVIFSQALEVTDVPLTNRMVFSKSGALELAGPYFRDIVCELSAHGVLNFEFLDQRRSPL
jgi:hypothetical protein